MHELEGAVLRLESIESVIESLVQLLLHRGLHYGRRDDALKCSNLILEFEKLFLSLRNVSTHDKRILSNRNIKFQLLFHDLHFACYFRCAFMPTHRSQTSVESAVQERIDGSSVVGYSVEHPSSRTQDEIHLQMQSTLS